MHKGPTHATTINSRRFNDFKYDTLNGQPVNFLLDNQTRPSSHNIVVTPKWSQQSDHDIVLAEFLVPPRGPF